MPKQVKEGDNQRCLERRHYVLQALECEAAPAKLFTQPGNQQLRNHDLRDPRPAPEFGIKVDARSSGADKAPGESDHEEEPK